MKIKRSHLVTITVEKNKEYTFHPNLKTVKQNVIFILNILCSFPVEVSIRFCGTEEMIQANSQFRNKHKPTDVLSFPPDRTFNNNPAFLGDILICVPTCMQQAIRAKHSLSAEVLKMLTHALVHLKGFDHDRDASSARIMTQLERSLKRELLAKFGEPNLEKETT